MGLPRAIGDVSKLARQQITDGYQTQGTAPEGNTSSGFMGTFLAATTLGSVVAAGLMYRKASGTVKTRIAQSISKLWNAPSIRATAVGKGVNRGLPAAASDLSRISYNVDKFSKSSINSIIEEYESITAKSGTKNLATIGDLLSKGKLPSRSNNNLNIALERLSLKGGINKRRLLNIPVGEGIVNKGDGIVDYRARTVGGIFADFLEFGHNNLKEPFTGFAPTDLFLHKSWANQSNVAILGKGAKVGGKDIKTGGIAVNSKVFEPSGEVHTFSEPLKILQENTSLTSNLHAIRGDLKSKLTDTLIDDGDYGFFTKKFLRLQRSFRNRSLSEDQIEELNDLISKGKWDKADEIVGTSKAASFWENITFSPKHAREGSVGRNIRVHGQRVHTNNLEFKDKPIIQGGTNGDKFTDEDLGAVDRVKKFFHMDSDKFKWVDNEGNVIGKGSTGPIKSHGRENIAPGALPDDTLNSAGRGSNLGDVSAVHTAATSDEYLKSVGHFIAERPIRLFEQFTGLGVAPSSSTLKTFLLGSAGVGLFMGGAVEAVKYANFVAGGVPAKIVGSAVGASQVAASAAMDVTGITTVADIAENALPGSVSSFASQITRAVGLPMLGAFLGGKYLKNVKIDLAKWNSVKKVAEDIAIQNAGGRKLGLLIGTAAGVASLAVEPTQYSTETYAEAVGDKKVAIRNSRYWVMGRTPYGGTSVKYHDFSLSYKLWHTGASDQTTYGSETQKWMHSWLPTPSNAFGLIPLLDPYYKEKHNQDLMPFPIIAPAGSNIPVIGPLVGATVGQILKPGVSFDVPDIVHPTSGDAETLGYDSQGRVIEPNARAVGTLNQQIANLQDFTGLFGFLSKFPMDAVTGSSTGFGGGTQLEDSSQIDSMGKGLAELNLGGALGMSELTRRLFNTPDSGVNYSNPIANAAMTWLPGSGSQFEGDKDYRINFHEGAFYNKVEQGSTRLPGPGYEAKQGGLHGGDAYDYVDIYNILSDVAPGSQAHAHYKNIITKNITKGFADESAIDSFNARESESAERLGGKYKFVDYAGQATTSTEMGDQVKEYLGYINVNKANTKANPILGPAQAIWDQASHFNLPGVGHLPLTSWLQGKFLHNRTPFEEYKQSNVLGVEFADWTKPYSAFIEPAGHEIFDFVTPGSTYIPARTEKRREVEEYYDKLKYLKSRRLQQRAESIGNERLAGKYAGISQQTVVGIPYSPSGINSNLFKALPTNTRPFASSIALATPEEANKFREVLPSHQLAMWNRIWTGNNNTNVQVEDMDTTKRADEEVSEYFSSRELPGTDSNVWNPDVDIDEYKLKTFEQESLSYFSQGIPEAKARTYRTIGRADMVLDSSPFSEDTDRRNNLLTELQGNDYVDSYRANSSAIQTTSRIYYNDPVNRQMYDDKRNGRF